MSKPYIIKDYFLTTFPQLKEARFRTGGIANLVNKITPIDGITIRRSVYIPTNKPPTLDTLLHELRHVQQFNESKFFFMFPLLWSYIRHGYEHSPFEVDARNYSHKQRQIL